MPITRHLVAALLLIAGAFGCADVSVTVPVPLEAVAGTYVLQSAAGGPLPAFVQHVTEIETGTQMQVYVLSDTLELDGHGRYQQRARIEVRAGGTVVNRTRWADHGTYTLANHRAHFASEYLQNIEFDGTASAASVILIQDLVGEGTSVAYVFQPMR